jgi:hypothetical protein
MKQALEALEYFLTHTKGQDDEKIAWDAIAALRQAIAEAEKQEPVAWGVFEGNLHDMFFTQKDAEDMARLKGDHAEVKPLYTAPQPQREWVGLTEEDKQEWIQLMTWPPERHHIRTLIDGIESELQEKNT